MLTKAKKSLLVSLSTLLCVMLLAFGLSTTSIFAHKTANAADDAKKIVVNGTEYATLAEAVNAVSDGGEIVVYGGEYTIPNVTYTGKSFTISAGDNQTVSFDMSVAHAIHGAKVTFNNVTFDYKTNGNYIGLQHADTLTYNYCTINGTVFLYATNETFNYCTFNQTSSGAYNVWTYGAKNVAFNHCEFNSAGRSVLVYNEGATAETVLTVSETKFVASETAAGKAAIEIDTSLMKNGATITVDDETRAEGFDAGSNSGSTLWNDKKQTADTNKNTTVTVADEVVFAPYVVAIGEEKYFSLTAAIAAAKAGDTVKLLADVEQNSEVAINKDITLDLNGKKIYNTEDIWNEHVKPAIVSLIDIENGANVTITGNGAIEAKENDCYTINITDGELTIENGTFVGNISVVQVEKGTLTINGGTFSLIQKMTDGKGADRYLINCIDDAFTAGEAKVAISGGSFAGFDPNVSPEQKVDGKAPSFAANGVGITKNADGSFTATANMAAQILDSDGNSVAAYDTLAEAFDNVNTGDTVTLLKDITLTEQINIVKALDGLTLDGNGHTIICKTTEDVFASGGSALYFGNANDKKYCTGIKIKDLTMSGKARFAIFLCGGTTTEFTNVNISGEYYIGVNLYGTHGATMTNCNISNSTEGTDEYISAVWSNVASANPLKLVNSTVSTIAINAYTSANKLEPKISIDKDSRAEVHTFDDGSVSGNKKLCVSTESEGTYTIKEFNETDKSWVDVVNPVAQIDSTYYQTLAEAIAAAKDGDTVKLLADCNGNGIQIDVGKFETKGLIVDFGGYTYTVGGVLVGSSGTGTNAFQLLKDNNITFKNGSIVGVTEGTKPAEDTPNWHGAPAMMIQNYANLTLYNMTISGGTETVYTMSNNNGNVVIENSTINAGSAKGCSYGPFAFDVCRFSSYPSVTVTVKGNSIINGDIEISGAIGAGQSRQLNIEGGEFSGTFKVSDVPANISISGGTFSNEIPADYCADGFRVAKNGDSYGVVEKYILTSQVTLGTDISFKYKVERTDLDKVELSYYKVGATEPTVYELTKDGDCYVFSGITPQMIDRKISVTVYAGDYVVYDVVEYSVLDYLQEVLDLYGDTTKNLVASLAYYGKAAMNHVGYETDTVETFITANNLAETTGEISGGTMVSGGTEKVAKLVVRFESQNKMLVKVSKDVFANYTYKITVNGKEIENVEWKTDIIDGYYVYATDGIAARYITDKDHSVAVKVYKDGEEVQSFQYNIAGYCVKLQDSEKFGEMAKATYNYGVAAAAYAAAQTNA